MTTTTNLSDLLPAKFAGTTTENSKVFFNRFKRSATSKALGLEWSDETAVTYFLTWLTGAAADWAEELQETQDCTKWTLQDWGQALGDRFPASTPIDYSLQSLASVKVVDEDWTAFVHDFKLHVQLVPNHLKTSALVLQVFKTVIAQENPQALEYVLMEIARAPSETTIDDKTLGRHYAALLAYGRMRSEINQLAGTPGSTIPLKTPPVVATVPGLHDLSKRMEALALKVNEVLPASSNVPRSAVCWNCGERGHGHSTCQKPRDEVRFQAGLKAYRDRIAATDKVLGAFCMQDDVEEQERVDLLSAAGIPSKRIRIDDLIDREPRTSTAQPILRPANAKGILKSKRRPLDRRSAYKGSTLTNALLDAPCGLTLRELLGSQSRAEVEAFLKSLQLSLKPMVGGFVGVPPESVGYVNTSLSSDGLSYVLVEINGTLAPAYLDEGSYFSIISKSLLEKMGLSITASESKLIKPLAGPAVAILGTVTLEVTLADDVKVAIRFRVMESPAVTILLGLDVCQALQVTREFDTRSCLWNALDPPLRTDLLSKEEMLQVLEEEYPDENIIDSPVEETPGFLLQVQQVLGLAGVDLYSFSSSDATIDFKALAKQTEVDFEIKGVDDLDFAPLDSLNSSKFDLNVDAVLQRCESCPVELMPELRSLLYEFKDIFPSSIVEMPRMEGFVYDPALEKEPEIPKYYARRFTTPQIQAMDELIDIGIPAGIVRPSKSPFINNLVFVTKPDGSLRPCLHAKIVNSAPKKKRYHLVPLIDECLEWIGPGRFKSFLDNLSGYWQVPIAEHARQYFAFRTHRGVFEFCVLVMGVDEGVYFYQEVMEQVFAEFLHKVCRVYLDDIGVKSDTPQQHLRDLRALFSVCRQFCVSLKLSKCLFFVVNHVWLGHQFSANGISANLNHPSVLALRNMPYPRSVKEVLHFCGLMEFFSRYLDHLAEKLVPLRRLVKKGAMWNFTDECRLAVDLVKDQLMKSPVLKLPDRIHRFVASADASKVALGGILEQYDDDNHLRPVGYWSKTLSPTQQDYPNYDRECLAQLGLWRFFRHLLLGVEFDAIGDCSAVSRLLAAEDPHGRRSRLFQGMTEFNAVMHHRPGVTLGGPDCFSRLVTVGLPSETFPPINLSSDSAFPKVLEFLLTGRSSSVRNDARFRRFAKQFIAIDGVLFRQAKQGAHLLVLESKAVLFQKLGVLHDRLGHFGFATIFNWVSTRWWRPQLAREVKDYCRGCDPCQRFSLTRPTFSFSGQTAISGLFNNWYGDFLGPFPHSKDGFRYVCIFVEPLTGFPEFAATPDATGFSAATVLEKEVICRYGVRGSVRVDQGPSFISGSFRQCCQAYGVQLEYSPAYVPELMGWVEQLNRTVRYALAKLCLNDYSNWNRHLPAIFKGIRCKVNSRSGVSPYYLMFGIEPSFPELGDPLHLSDSDTPSRLLELDGLNGARKCQVRPSVSSQNKPVFHLGDVVKVFNPKLRKRGVLGKSHYRFSHPFIVIACYDHDLYDLQSEDGALRECVHASLLQRYYSQSGPASFSARNGHLSLNVMGAMVQMNDMKNSLILSVSGLIM